MHLLLHTLTTEIHSIMEQINHQLDAFKWFQNSASQAADW